MSLTDPIGDMLARIKNSQLRNHKKVEMPSSNFKIKIADVLKNEGYINGFTENYVKVKAPWNPELVNTIHQVKLTEIDEDGLVRFDFIT